MSMSANRKTQRSGAGSACGRTSPSTVTAPAVSLHVPVLVLIVTVLAVGQVTEVSCKSASSA
jgi:hypothetical protein